MNRRVIAAFSALMIVFQMIAAPVASAATQGSPGAGCDHGGNVHTWHPDDDCGDGSHQNHDAVSTQHHPAPAGRCHCVHSIFQTSAVGGLLVVPPLPRDAEAVTGPLQGPAYSAPLFDFFRPPK